MSELPDTYTAKKLEVHNHPDNRIPYVEIPAGTTVFMATPTELHHYNEGKSLAIVLDRPGDMRIIGEIPLDILNNALAELGYTLYQP